MRRQAPFAIAAAVLIAAALAVPALGASGMLAGGSQATVYACVSSNHTFTHVSVASPLACPSQKPVSWPVTAGGVPSPSPSPTSASPSPSSASPSPSPSPSSSPSTGACVISGYQSPCGPYYDGISATDPFNAAGGGGQGGYVSSNTWGCGGVPAGDPGSLCGPQTVTASGMGNWSVTSDQAAGNGAVLTYPDDQVVYTSTDATDPPLSGFTSITSSFAEDMGANSGTDAEAAYDMWLGSLEVMVWVDNHGQTPAGSQVGTVTLSGRSWQVYSAGPGGSLSFVAAQNFTSGQADLLAFLDWAVSHGYASMTDTLGQIDFGWEICSTGGVPETFTVSSYTLAAT